jgi:hypothetical protein
VRLVPAASIIEVELQLKGQEAYGIVSDAVTVGGRGEERSEQVNVIAGRPPYRRSQLTQGDTMKTKTLLIATAMILTATGGAFAQTSGAMPNTYTGGSKAQPEAGSNSSAPTRKDSQNMEMQKDKSPASTNSGISQEK